MFKTQAKPQEVKIVKETTPVSLLDLTPVLNKFTEVSNKLNELSDKIPTILTQLDVILKDINKDDLSVSDYVDSTKNINKSLFEINKILVTFVRNQENFNVSFLGKLEESNKELVNALRNKVEEPTENKELEVLNRVETSLKLINTLLENKKKPNYTFDIVRGNEGVLKVIATAL
jgi:hypothetical protein